MRDEAFQDWRRERDAVEQEMDHLIAAGMPSSVEERQVRRTRFAALVERREAAARNLLQSDRRRFRSPRAPSRPGDHFVSAAHQGAAAEGEQAAFVPLPDGRRNAEAQSGLATHYAAVPASGVPAHTAELPDVTALAPDAAGSGAPLAAHSHDAVANIADTAPLAADATAPSAPSSADLHSDAAPLAPDHDAAVGAAGVPADAAEIPADVAADAFLPHSVAVPAGTPAAAHSHDAVANTADASPLVADATAPSAPSSADLHSDAAPLAPDHDAAVGAAGVPADAAEIPADVAADAFLPHSVAVPAGTPAAAHSHDAVANTADAAPLAADAEVSALASSDRQPSAYGSLLTLLRRLQSRAPNEG